MFNKGSHVVPVTFETIQYGNHHIQLRPSLLACSVGLTALSTLAAMTADDDVWNTSPMTRTGCV